MDFLRRLFGGPDSTVKEEAPPPRNTGVDTQPIVPPPDTAPEEGAAADTSELEDKDERLQTRPLEMPEPFAAGGTRLRFGHATDTGRTRKNNQDSDLALLVSIDSSGNAPVLGLFVVADGMGGHTDGEIASEVAVQTIAKHFVEDIVANHLRGSNARSADARTIPEVLSEAMESANQAVQMQVPSGGTTATAMAVRGDFAYFAHVGDSRAYLITNGEHMELITRDHSLVKRLQELNQITQDEADIHPQKNVLYRAIGQNTQVDADAATRRLPPSSMVLMCSDGLWGVVPEEEILSIIREAPDPQTACEQLVDAANENGGPDNITVVIVQMPDKTEPAANAEST